MKENSLEGYVYIATNPAYQGSVKIGYTGKHPALRLKQLSGQTAIKDPFVNQWYVKVKAMKLAEQLLYYEFNNYREHSNKEYFEIDLEEAIAKSEKILLDFFGSLEDRYCKLNLPLYKPNIVDTTYLSNIQEKNAEWTEDITEYLSDKYEISPQIDGLFLKYYPDFGTIWLTVYLHKDSSEITTELTKFVPTQLSLFDKLNRQGYIFISNQSKLEVLDLFLSHFDEIYAYTSNKLSFKYLEQLIGEDLLKVKNYQNYNSKIVGYCIEVLRYIEQGYENFKLSEEKIELLSGLIEALDELPNVPHSGYNFDITLNEKGEYGSGNTVWSISISDSVFNVDKTISTYDKEIGSDWHSPYNYEQHVGCKYSSEGYAQEWYDDLLVILSGNHTGDLEIDIDEQDE